MADFITGFPVFLLVFVRMSAFFLTMPLFSYRNIPAQHKIGLAFYMAVLVFFSIDKPALEIGGMFYLLILKEAAAGLAIGLFAFIILGAVQVAGGFIDFQMGFAIANVIDPQTGVQSPLVGQYLYTFALMLLLALDGHHLLLDGAFYSYQIIPVEQPGLMFGDVSFIIHVMKTFSLMFAAAFQMAIPVVGSLFLVDIALGIVARTVPQLNVFVVGLPLKIAVSFLVLFIVMPVFMMLIENLFEEMFYAMRGLMELLVSR